MSATAHPSHPADDPQYQADPWADNTIAQILGDWPPVPADATPAERLAAQAEVWQRVAQVNRLIAQWQTNGDLPDWHAPPGADPQVARPLQHYVHEACALPRWADPAKIRRAEELFMDYGPLSCVLLFCASLPECYVIPDLAAVLHETGQLEQHTEYRIRMTAAMIFPVMLHGGLTTERGSGVAQVLKVRLIHAMIRHLILRGNPSAALHTPGAGQLPPLARDSSQDMHQALYTRGWDTAADGLPCNQEELAYTLLTFSYVFLRGMRRLGLGLATADEEAFLHTWNVVGDLLGIHSSLMAHSMPEAERLFARIQARGCAHPYQPDPRPALAQALMDTMAAVIPPPVLKPFPVLMTRYLCGHAIMRQLSLQRRVGLVSRLLFDLMMLLVRVFDSLMRLIWPDFSIARFITRVLGYPLTAKLLMDQTRPLRLPNHLLSQMGDALDHWGDDPKAPRWLNALEDRWTVKGSWRPQPQNPQA